MSYILDALNKSEQERQHERLPNLKTSHVPIIGHSGQQPLLVILGTILVMLLLAGMTFTFWYLNLEPNARTTSHTGQEVGSPPTSENPTAYAEKAREPSMPELSANSALSLEDNNPVSESGTARPGLNDNAPFQPAVLVQPGEEMIVPQTIQPKTESPEPNSNAIPDIVDLPVSIQKRIPALTFSTHIYASEAAWRMVGINGRSRREGDIVSDSLRLLEITEDGVVLEYDHQAFRMSVLRNWSGR